MSMFNQLLVMVSLIFNYLALKNVIIQKETDHYYMWEKVNQKYTQIQEEQSK